MACSDQKYFQYVFVHFRLLVLWHMTIGCGFLSVTWRLLSIMKIVLVVIID